MIDSTTGQAEPCPMCGSRNVRWRRRRWYDVVRNEIRFWTELSAFFGKPDISNAEGSISTHRRDSATMLDSESELRAVASGAGYGVAREHYEARIARATPCWFWNCGGCDRKGHLFEDAAGLLAPRANLAEWEGRAASTIDAQVYNGVDRTGRDSKD